MCPLLCISWVVNMPCAALMSEQALVCTSREDKDHAMNRNLLLVKQPAGAGTTQHACYMLGGYRADSRADVSQEDCSQNRDKRNSGVVKSLISPCTSPALPCNIFSALLFAVYLYILLTAYCLVPCNKTAYELSICNQHMLTHTAI